MTMKRYVVLAHDWPSPHYDLMLEEEGVLKTWRIPQWPLAPAQQGEALPDHRLLYLEYEGKIENNRGTVKRVGSGNYQTLERKQHQWAVSLTGSTTGMLIIHYTGTSVQLVWQAQADGPHVPHFS